MKAITIFTPTYNRAFTLPILYQSLLSQKCLNFEWLIIDDGSTDCTKRLVEKWKEENKIFIRYIYQSNAGMLSAHNKAYDNIFTELNCCVDSDDSLTENAIELILNVWKSNSNENFAGMLGLDIDKGGELIGDKFPENLKFTTFTELKEKYKNKGDKKFIYRTQVINEFPRFPVFEGEKFPAAGYLYRLIDQKYKLLLINEPLCIVDYQLDGNSKNKISQYIKNPNAFAYYRKERMRLSTSFSIRYRNAIHYVSSCIFSRKYSKIFDTKFNGTVFLALPLGIALNIYLRKTKKKGII